MGKSKNSPPAASDEDVRALLERYGCPTPFHAVRTRFLGSIATPGLSVQPTETVKALWGGDLPAFDNLDAVNDLLGALIMGLWNRLTRHQERRFPFRLSRVELTATPSSIASVAQIRCEELDGFVDGLFGDADQLDLPERAHRALEVLVEVRVFFQAMCSLASDPARQATAADIATTVANVRKLSRIVEHEIHEAVLSCTRARRQWLELMSTAKPTLH